MIILVILKNYAQELLEPYTFFESKRHISF